MNQQGNIIIGQNYPNPRNGIITIPFTLVTPSDIKLEIFDLEARKVGEVSHKNLYIGDHSITLDLESMGIPTADYIYQLEVSNSEGIFRERKVMTAR